VFRALAKVHQGNYVENRAAQTMAHSRAAGYLGDALDRNGDTLIALREDYFIGAECGADLVVVEREAAPGVCCGVLRSGPLGQSGGRKQNYRQKK
jgi:hypothetical protein